MFPPFKGDWISDEHQPMEDDVITRLRSSTSRAGLRQFNNIKDEDDYLHNLVFSSVPVTVARCPRPLAPEEWSWNRALQFDLNSGAAECCQPANDAAEANCTHADGGRRETRQEDVGALVDALVQSKWEDVTRSLPELIERELERSAAALRGAREECDRLVRENSAVGATCAALRARIERLEGDSERFAKMEERMRTLEERAAAHRETDEDMDASALGSTADTTLTTTSSHTTRSQHPNTMGSQHDDKFINKVAAEVTLMSTSSPIFNNNTTPTRMESRISDTSVIEPSTSGSASSLKVIQDSDSSSNPTTSTASSSRPTEAPADIEVRDILASTGSPIQAPSACSSSTKLHPLSGSVQLDSEKNGIGQIQTRAKSDIEKATQEIVTEQKQLISMTSPECAASCSNQTSDSNIVETFGTSEGDATASVTTRGSGCEAEVCPVTNEARRSRNRAGEPREDRKSFGEIDAIKLANIMTFLSELVGENFDSVNWEKLSAVHDFVQKFKPNIDPSAIGRSFGVATSDITRNSGTDKENSNTSEPRGREERTESNNSMTSL